jgi:hypothetical protein
MLLTRYILNLCGAKMPTVEIDFNYLGWDRVHEEHIDWIRANCKGHWQYQMPSFTGIGKYYFEDTDEAVRFKLRWG